METKKDPRYDVHRHSRQFFLLGLGVSIATVIVAFEWTSGLWEPGHKPPRMENVDPFVLTYIPVTAQVPDVPKPPKIVRTVDLVQVEPIEDVTEPVEQVEIIEPLTVPSPVQVVVPEIEDEIVPVAPFRRVEQMPAPVGGYETFYSVLRKNIRYPKVAIRQSVEGYVSVQFTVNETGELSDFKILKSLGAGCDEEAVRVISLTKWQAGKQRGRPVKVYMIQPVFFALR